MDKRKRKRTDEVETYSMIQRIPDQVKRLNRMVGVTDIDCIENLRMDRNTFGRLCLLLRQLGGLTDGKYVSVEEQVAMFVTTLAHHQKNRIVSSNFWRSGQTVSHYLHVVLRGILKLHGIFLAKPEPVAEDSNDPNWKWFKGCLGALDGIYINVVVPNIDKPRYRTRKGEICMNTLAVCDQNMKFVYVLSGWEGSAADSRVLRDAVNRVHGLKVPRGNYYLCDNDYTNSEGFLSPYEGVRYHMKEWGPECERPQNAQEMFNMRHTKARNVIERALEIMKMRWGILRNAPSYPVKVHNRLIMSCFLLHNFIRSEMVHDPIEELIDELPTVNVYEEHGDEEEDGFVDATETSPEWNQTRDAMAQAMWTES
ncbi:uncharacterized protein LOC130995585 isoform X2 [Salvia miltiorrhiza]|nr:uncharacterized protein LOC130995585 isoform X2 [Salvia miltiorrhiza]XP_057776922.1 uncharacterized protein LOC130995585 isoform X2 [Salvia miltiorrhiza]XP_057776923.1 uncharacterized protein LOC130995585 isoform X2 [Salvia miltiorrhiza]